MKSPSARNARADAAYAVCRVVAGRQSLRTALDKSPSATQAPLVQELSYGTCRWWHQLSAIQEQLMPKPLRKKDLDIQCLLNIGLYQLEHMRLPDHAVLNETVQATVTLKKPWARGLINGALRNYRRRRDELNTQAHNDPASRHSLPRWLLNKLRTAWPEDWQQIGLALLDRPPLTLRVNTRLTDTRNYLQRLEADALQADVHPHIDTALTLSTPMDVNQLPGFAQGMVSVQDAAAQFCAPLLACEPGSRVLDACSAPGGKTAHLLESADNNLDLTAIDIDAERLCQVEETLKRLDLNATLIAADATRPADWWDGKQFDRIVVDAPCSATGVIRRHPDIKLLRTEADIEALRIRQSEILHALWPLLASNGMLLYVTCSILPEENHEQIRVFLEQHCDARLYGIKLPGALDQQGSAQIVPGEAGMDGFYYARLQKQS